jgi:hypothetical protein
MHFISYCILAASCIVTIFKMNSHYVFYMLSQLIGASFHNLPKFSWFVSISKLLCAYLLRIMRIFLFTQKYALRFKLYAYIKHICVFTVYLLHV